jgi:phosphoribosylformylglycinamidine cyclo-ligase
MPSPTTYKDSGVDIDAGDELVDRIKTFSKKTKRVEVISGIGGFAGLFSLASSRVKNPVLVASTDGVGTKLKLAIDMGKYDTIGQDLVAMCVNDLICCGAEPLFFLDYFATGRLDTDTAAAIISSIATSLGDINCALLGGETAEMPGLYRDGDFDLAGFSVGLVDKNDIIDGSSVGLGDLVIGLASSGVHSNGYSLVRRIIADAGLDLAKPQAFAPQGLGPALLEPTMIYVNAVLNLIKISSIHAMAHITGGGIVGNLPRVLPKTCKAVLDKKRIETPELFLFLKKTGNVPEDEMWRVFNMGVGYMLVVKASEGDTVLQQLKGMNVKATLLGTIEKKKAKDEGVEFA